MSRKLKLAPQSGIGSTVALGALGGAFVSPILAVRKGHKFGTLCEGYKTESKSAF